MIGACKPTVPLLDYEQVVLSKGIINPDAAVSVEPTLINRPVTGRCSVVRNDTSQHSSSVSTLPLLWIAVKQNR